SHNNPSGLAKVGSSVLADKAFEALLDTMRNRPHSPRGLFGRCQDMTPQFFIWSTPKNGRVLHSVPIGGCFGGVIIGGKRVARHTHWSHQWRDSVKALVARLKDDTGVQEGRD